MKQIVFFIALISLAFPTTSQDAKAAPEKPKLKFLGAFDGGQPGITILKLFDESDDVVCYVLTPEVAGRHKTADGLWVYDGNGVGAISCLKVRIGVIPIVPITNGANKK